MKTAAFAVSTLLACVAAPAALAQPEAAPAIRFDLAQAQPQAQPQNPPQVTPQPITVPAPVNLADKAAIAVPAPAFGAADGNWWLTASTAVGTVFGDETSVALRASLTTFVAQDIQIGGEAGLWYLQQPGDNAVGGAVGFVLRWHFVNTGDWTVFADTGIAILATTEDTPRGGTSVNFKPRLGVGFTRLLADDGTRLEVGLGWHHISNARINGDDENPSRDLPMLHVGIVFPL